MMNNALLAVLVILSFVFVGFAIGQKLFWLAGLLFLSGFALMSVGLRRKRKRDEIHAD
ncbi:hypothetical protein JF544_03545 [Halobacillus kuroshimensis]|uniref:LPXTG cell wall anchor domain-containing protein n=1 Tax=Halobacillus kuroshimensis TaxID=302481 RepID=A0ABS3DSH7_9BACI|nr:MULTISPECIES: hypothetical protein [Halobacillus]MBN8234303.1 hypothetical protein [Halobacillus kuroshimensis]